MIHIIVLFPFKIVPFHCYILTLLQCCKFFQYGETPLHMAAKNGCSESAQILIVHGASLEAKTNVSIMMYLCPL